MKIMLESFACGADIPAADYLKNKKLAKYFNRETAAAIVCSGKLLSGMNLPSDTPFYYATGIMEYEDYGLDAIADSSRAEDGTFSQKAFIEKAMPAVSPLTQFKVLYNMPLCFVSIEHGLRGDNAVLYSVASSLVAQALAAPAEPILLGAGKVHKDGTVESGFALIDKKELASTLSLLSDDEAIGLFHLWAGERNPSCRG